MNSVCSACGAKLVWGRKNCGGCGLAISAMALPVAPARAPKTRLGFFFWMAVLLIFAVMVGEAVNKYQTAQRRQARATILAQLHGGQLSSPEAFQARCGQATSLWSTAAGPTLRYNGIDLLVSFPAAKDGIPAPPRFQMERAVQDAGGAFRDYDQNVSSDFALDQLHCGR
jgi:hypothetical protein